jgi:hypothetical protein
MNWNDPVAVRRHKCLKARIRRTQRKAAGLCRDCGDPMVTRGVCDVCQAQRRLKYRLMIKPRLAIGAKPCLDCGRLPKRATSIRCVHCQCRRAARMRYAKGQAA